MDHDHARQPRRFTKNHRCRAPPPGFGMSSPAFNGNCRYSTKAYNGRTEQRLPESTTTTITTTGGSSTLHHFLCSQIAARPQNTELVVFKSQSTKPQRPHICNHRQGREWRERLGRKGRQAACIEAGGRIKHGKDTLHGEEEEAGKQRRNSRSDGHFFFSVGSSFVAGGQENRLCIFFFSDGQLLLMGGGNEILLMPCAVGLLNCVLQRDARGALKTSWRVAALEASSLGAGPELS